MSPVSLRLAEVRRARGMTQQELAAAAGLRSATISDIETGKTKGIDFATLERIAGALGVNAAVLIHHDDAAQPAGAATSRARKARTPTRRSRRG